MQRSGTTLILLRKPLRWSLDYFQMGIYNTFPDFHSEEVTIIKKNKEDLNNAVEDMAEHLPKEDPGKG